MKSFIEKMAEISEPGSVNEISHIASTRQMTRKKEWYLNENKTER